MFYPWPLLVFLVGAILIWIGATDRAQGVHDALFTASAQEGTGHGEGPVGGG